MNPHRLSSIQTRIKTYSFDAFVVLEPTHRLSSIQTRIKTSHTIPPRHFPYLIDYLPFKQGLMVGQSFRHSLGNHILITYSLADIVAHNSHIRPIRLICLICPVLPIPSKNARTSFTIVAQLHEKYYLCRRNANIHSRKQIDSTS